MKIAIIGGGAAGLAALKHSLEDGHECIVFEQTGTVGGTWNYVDFTDFDENGLPVHSSMYQGLMTNLPKEVMEFEGFHYEEKGRSFVPQSEVVEYINKFAEHYHLFSYVKFYTSVSLIEPLPGEKWKITVRDVKSNKANIYTFDAVIICTGNYYNPKLPTIPGRENFKGKCIHSHNYRVPDPYKDKKVLVIGAGPSGTDISRLIFGVAEKVYVSYGDNLYEKLQEGVIGKPKVIQLFEKSAKFEDGTEEDVDEIIFCTGYLYTYPFLSNKCGITVDNNWVRKLYKHVINIEHPTMAFIGIVFKICPFPAFCVQVRFFLSLLKQKFEVSKTKMLEDYWKDRAKREKLGYPDHWAHKIGTEQGLYFDDLADTANIERIPPVINKIYTQYKRDPRYRYKIIDNDNFIIYEV